MAEPGSGMEPANDAVPVVGPAAVLALGAGKSRAGAKLPPESAAWLEAQAQLARAQLEDLERQEKRQGLRDFGDRLRIGMQLLGVVFGLALALVVGAAAWSAHQDHGVVIEAFSVPPDLAQRGLTGQVAASQLLDRLAELQSRTVTTRPASTYANDWGGDIKVEIPQTGVSIGELNRYLRQWLGRQTRISGEIVRIAGGVAVTVRAGDAPGRRFEGAEADVDKLIGAAAEAVYTQTQPYRYAVFLASTGRREEAVAAFSRLARSDSPEERAWAYVGWGSLLTREGRLAEAVTLGATALRLNPRLQPAYIIYGGNLDSLRRQEESLASVRREVALIRSGRAIGLSARAAPSRLRLMSGVEAYIRGDYRRAAELMAAVESFDTEGQSDGYDPRQGQAQALIFLHDVAASKRITAQVTSPFARTLIEGMQAVELGEPSVMARLIDGFAAHLDPVVGDNRFGRFAWDAAMAYARAGRIADAERMLSVARPDCYNCVATRGLIAALKRDWAGVDRWYAQAARLGPSLPFAHTDWGRALLMKGDLDGAIVKLQEAHRRTPGFADPLELWGEALMRKADLSGAIAKFREADRGAPRWGRNHLYWGQALMLAGRYREARAQYRIAQGLDLTRAERAALGVLLARTASGPLSG
jgi:tetratricopeptide (TPR) repeat protein